MKTWQGVLEQAGREFPFTMELHQWGPEIGGTITDEFGLATFAGTLVGNDFRFLKSYTAGSSAGATFQYVGKYFPHSHEVKGIWYQVANRENAGSFRVAGA